MSSPQEVLERAATIAVVGMSQDTGKPSGDVPAQLQARGFRVIPVNPTIDEVQGEKAYASLTDVPGPVDLVVVFRPSDEAPDIARQSVTTGAKGLWLQVGIVSEEAREIAEEAGLDFIEDRCTGVEARRHGIRKPG
jgi:predicted CoA-binding protein